MLLRPRRSETVVGQTVVCQNEDAERIEEMPLLRAMARRQSLRRAGNVRFRLHRMTRGGMFSICHLIASAVALVVALDGIHWSTQVPWLVLSFPLMYLLWLLPDDPDWLAARLSRAGALLLFLCLLAANSYLWGHPAAYVRRRIVRWRRRGKMPTQPA